MCTGAENPTRGIRTPDHRDRSESLLIELSRPTENQVKRYEFSFWGVVVVVVYVMAEGEAACEILCLYRNEAQARCESPLLCVISGCCSGVNEIFALLGSCEAWIGSCRRFGTTCGFHLQGSIRWDR